MRTSDAFVYNPSPPGLRDTSGEEEVLPLRGEKELSFSHLSGQNGGRSEKTKKDGRASSISPFRDARSRSSFRRKHRRCIEVTWPDWPPAKFFNGGFFRNFRPLTASSPSSGGVPSVSLRRRDREPAEVAAPLRFRTRLSQPAARAHTQFIHSPARGAMGRGRRGCPRDAEVHELPSNGKTETRVSVRRVVPRAVVKIPENGNAGR